MFDRISKFVASATFIINILLCGLYIGYSIRFKEDGFFISGGNGYESIAQYYIYICLFLLIFFLGKTIKYKILSNIVCIVTLGLTFFFYRFIYLQKSLFYNNGLPLSKLLKISTPLDWISFSLALVLLILQIIAIYLDYFSKKRQIT